LTKAKYTREYVVPHHLKPKHRNVFILCDGTWNDENGKKNSGLVTNVVKLFRMLGPDTERQIARYYRGIGNDDDYSWIKSLIAGATGHWERDIRDNIYSTIVKEYRPGDRIHIFGFSRGAATARMIAMDLHEKGIPERIRITTRSRQNRTTRNVENRFVRCETEGQSHPVAVEFLGAWDTVYAFGIPLDIGIIPFQSWDPFQNHDIAPNIKRAVHLLAIDETRDAFKPKLMNAGPHIEEIWLPGVHADVGGSFPEDALGVVSLRLMIDRLSKHCSAYTTKLDLDPSEYERYTKLDYDSPYIWHFHGLGGWFYTKSVRDIHVQVNEQADRERKPNIYSIVDELRNDRYTFSHIKDGKDSELVRFQYYPRNVKLLEGRFKWSSRVKSRAGKATKARKQRSG
jgi:uncharacterized protein (DUF2235 family)